MTTPKVTVRFFLIGEFTDEVMCSKEAEKNIKEVSQQISSGCSLYSRIPSIL
jgi:hypothetical protein